jgi:type I restriction enzyme R subunit
VRRPIYLLLKNKDQPLIGLTMAQRTVAVSELITFKELIDKELSAAGWRVTLHKHRPLSGFERCALEEYATQNGPANHAHVIGGRVVAMVEAKEFTLGPQNVLSQAERYARHAVLGRR